MEIPASNRAWEEQIRRNNSAPWQIRTYIKDSLQELSKEVAFGVEKSIHRF
jgi:hypothetical protein